jgi:alginate O-acetyltransferase complex protein AlgI
MFFNSIDFAIFFPVLFLAYWVIGGKNIRIQNVLIVIASYIFYGWWDWRFLFLIAFSTVVDYLVGWKMESCKKKSQRKLLLAVSLVVNLGLLGFFKYYNFFIENFTEGFSFLGHSISTSSLNIILPVGISFYTFQTLSYSIDIYRDKMKPTKDFIAFTAFVSFFPQLVAGPIERATHLLPQFFKKRSFDYHRAVDGCRQILWGLFKKIVIADNCAEYANYIFNNYESLSGSTLVIGALLFTFQIYGDFSGYSDIAIGTSRLLGFDLKQNFAFPYFSRDIAEFWRRWHISLSTWFRDYLYIPLGGSRGSLIFKIRNVFIIFLVSGFWHGANWTFIIWGALNALYFLPLLLLNKNRNHLDVVAINRHLPSLKELASMLTTFGLTVLAWIFFRADSVTHAIHYLKGIFSKSIISLPHLSHGMDRSLIILSCFLVFFIVIEWVGRRDLFAIEKLGLKRSRVFTWSFYFLLSALIYLYQGKEQEFIYFQF